GFNLTVAISCCYSLLWFVVMPAAPKISGAVGKLVSVLCRPSPRDGMASDTDALQSFWSRFTILESRFTAYFFLFSSTTSNSASTTSPSRLPAPSSLPPCGCASGSGCGPGRGPACAEACLYRSALLSWNLLC